MSSYDIIVLGSGAGGGTLVHRLARAVNPALTAMAHALRVGDHLLERLGAPKPEKEPARAG
jgi:choline dehydrogenase-like flavoprotein